MSRLARLRGLTLSVLLHAGAGAAIVAWSTADWARPLFVDLLERAEPSAVTGAGASPAQPARLPPPPTRAGVAAPAPPVAPQPPAPPREPSAPALPPVAMTGPVPVVPPPVPAPPAVEPAPLATPPALAPSTSELAAPAPASANLPPPAPGPGRSGASEPGSGGRVSGETRGDVGSAPAGAPGAPLALAAPGGAVPPEYGPYLRRFRQLVHEALVYPLAARRQGLGGIVELDVWLEATGLVRDVRVVRSSSHRLLDDAAVATIGRLGPIPFPDSLPRRSLLIRIPLVFELR